MAIDHRIIQQIGIRDNAPALNMFQNTLSQVQNRNIQQQQANQQLKAAPFQQQLLEQQAAAGAAQQQDATNQRKLKSINDFAISNQSIINNAVNTGDPTQLQSALVKRREQLVAQGLPTTETDEGLVMLGQGNIQGVVSALSDSVRLFNQQQGQGATAGQREFAQLSELAKGDPNSDATKAARIKLGLDPRASLSAQERIASNQQLGQQVADQEGAEAGAAESAKQKAQLKFKPQITKAVKMAEKEATERGEVLTDLARMEASLPGVKEVVNELLELSDIATSTLGGKAFDFVVKQSGFGSTKGADAKAKMIAIVDNQVLPLLKETFGAAFTVQEGDNLKASLVDPDASPSQKRAQLESFLAQKERNIRTKQNQLGQQATAEAGINEFLGFKVIR